MSSHVEVWPPPNDPKAFESLCLDLWKAIWNDPHAQMNGRSGQPQAGVDVFGQQDGGYVGIQCKQKDGLLRTKLTTHELETEVEAAHRFKPALKSFIVATTGPRDASLQERARALTKENAKNGDFSVAVYSWPDIWHDLYDRPDLLRQLRSKYWPQLTESQSTSRTGDRGKVGALILVPASLVCLLLFFLLTGDKQRPTLGLPIISFETAPGLPIPDEPNGSWSHDDQAHLRLHKLSIYNTNNTAIIYFDAIIQLPEPVATNRASIYKPPGIDVHWEPDIPETVTIGEVTRIGSRPLTGVWKLRVEKIPPEQKIQLSFFTTTRGIEARNYLEIQSLPAAFSNAPPIIYFLAGTYSLDRVRNPTNHGVYTVLKFDPKTRFVTATPAQRTTEDGNLRKITIAQ